MSSTSAEGRSVAGPRRELKIAVDHEALDWARSLIRLHPAGFVETWPARWINSIYFDSQTLHNYEENVAGIANRRKVRVRWYGDLEGDGSPTLEFKVRKNGLGWKVRYRLEQLRGIAARPWGEISRAVAQTVDDEDRLVIEEDDRPVLVNRYVRDYYRSAGGECDLTLDGCFSFFDQRYGTGPNVSRPAPTFRGMVIELKFAVGAEKEIRRISSSFPFRLTKSSKYVLGVQACMA